MKWVIVFFLLIPTIAFGQLCHDEEADTLIAGEALASLRYALNDYGADTRYPDSVLYDYLNQSKWAIESQGLNERRDTIVTSDTTTLYWLATDFMVGHGVMFKNDGQWGAVIRPDSQGYGIIPKQDTIITVSNTAMYTLNADYVSMSGAVIKQGERWRALEPRDINSNQGGIGRNSRQNNVLFYSVFGRRLFLDEPPSTGGDSVIVFYNSFGYTFSDKRLVITNPVPDDSIVVFYGAYGNQLTASDVIVDIPYQYRSQLIEGAYNLATRADDN